MLYKGKQLKLGDPVEPPVKKTLIPHWVQIKGQEQPRPQPIKLEPVEKKIVLDEKLGSRAVPVKPKEKKESKKTKGRHRAP